ncbi:MAG: hypothetical protein ACYTXA_13200 [Nostoc sp.]
MQLIDLISLRDRKNNHTSRLAMATPAAGIALKQPKYLSQLLKNIKFLWIATPATLAVLLFQSLKHICKVIF